MAQQLIWTAGLVGHLVLAGVLLTGGRARRFPLFTSLTVFEVLRAVALALIPRHVTHHALAVSLTSLDVTGLVLEAGVLVELVLTALRPLGKFRRATLALLLLAAGLSVAFRLAPIRLPMGSELALWVHFLLAVLFLEWSVILAVLLRTLRLRWWGEIAAISFGFGAYSASLIFAGAYFRVGREMSDFIFFSHLRIGIYLAVLVWWIATLWNAGRAHGRESAATPEPAAR